MNKLQQSIVEYRIKQVINTPHLKAKYLAEYKRQNGSDALDEGIRDWLKSKFSSAKTAVKSAATKVSNVAQGIADIGFLGRGTTIFNGVETFDIEKRKTMISQAEGILGREITELTSIFEKYAKNEKLNYGTKLLELNKSLINTGFPNSKSFGGEVKLIKDMYFEITQNYKNKLIKDKLANLTIAVLRHLVIFYQDYKVYDKNLYLNEDQRRELKALLREQADVVQNNGEDEDYAKVKGRKQGDVSASYKAAYSAKLPVALIIGGASLAALGIGANSEMFQNLLERFKDMGEATEGIAGEVSKVIIGKGQGITQVLGNMTGADLGPNVKVSSLSSAAIKALAPAMRAAVVAKNGEAGGQAFDQVMNLAGTDSNQTLGQVLQGQLSGTGKSVSDLLDVDAGSFTKVIQDKVNAIAAKPLDTVKNTLLKWMGKFAGPVLTGLGFAVAAGGVASAALRTKGKLSSRMATLKNLVDTFKDVGSQEEEGEGGGEPPQPPEPPPPVDPASEQPMFYVKKSGGKSLRKTSLNTLLLRKLTEPMASLNITGKLAKGLINGIVKIAYDSLKGQGATIQEARFGFDPKQSKPYLGDGVERNKTDVTDDGDDIVDTSKAHKFSVPLSPIQKFVRDFYSKNVQKTTGRDEELIGKELSILSGEINSLVQKWVKYQTSTSQEQLKGKKDSEERIKKAKQTLGINESQVNRWKKLAGIIKG